MDAQQRAEEMEIDDAGAMDGLERLLRREEGIVQSLMREIAGKRSDLAEHTLLMRVLAYSLDRIRRAHRE